MAEPVQPSDRRRKEIFTTSLVHPRTGTKFKLVGLLLVDSVIETDVTFGMIFALPLVDEWIHSRAILESPLLGCGENTIACPACFGLSKD